MEDLRTAKETLLSGRYTCVLCKKDEIYTSSLRGVKPLVLWLKEGKSFKDYSAADKVVGKATAFLYVLLSVRTVYASVISISALRVLSEKNITVKYELLVESIINRQGDGICPFEQAVLDIDDEHAAYERVLAKMKEMNITL